VNTTALLVPQEGMLILSEAQRSTITQQVTDATAVAEKAKKSALAITEIDDDAMMAIATGELRDIATARKKLEDRRKEITRPMDAAKNFVMDLFSQPGDQLAEGEKHLRTVVQKRLDAVAAEQRERQRLADAEAERQRQAAEERRLAAEIEAAHAEAIVEDADRAGLLEGEARMALARQAEEALEAVEEATAEVEVAEVTAHAVAVLAPRARGVSTAGKWIVESFDKLALIQAAAQDPAKFAMYLEVDEQRLRQYVTMMKDEAVVPGVVFSQQSQLRVRSRS
jgi:hypothetical protein